MRLSDPSRRRSRGVLLGLGMRFVGERTAQLLASHFGSMDALMAASVEELTQVNEVGPKVAEAVREFFDEPRNVALIERLREAGLTFTAEKRVTTTTLEGLTFVLTGTLPTLTREAAKEKIEACGGEGRREREQEDELRGGRRRGGLEAGEGEQLGVKVLDEAGLLELLG